MKNFLNTLVTLVGVHTHTHTSNCLDKINNETKYIKDG